MAVEMEQSRAPKFLTRFTQDLQYLPDYVSFPLDFRFSQLQAETDILTPEGRTFHKAFYGNPNAKKYFIIVGGRGSNVEPRQKFAYTVLSNRLARKGYGVITYTYGDDIMFEDVQGEENVLNNYGFMADDMAAEMVQLNSEGRELNIHATSAGAKQAVDALQLAGDKISNVFLGLNDPILQIHGKRLLYAYTGLTNVSSVHLGYALLDEYFDPDEMEILKQIFLDEEKQVSFHVNMTDNHEVSSGINVMRAGIYLRRSRRRRKK